MRFKINDFVATPAQIDMLGAVLRGGQLTCDERVAAFESSWALRMSRHFCVAFSSGTAALLGTMQALISMGRLSSKHVLTNASAYPAAANVLRLAGLVPVFVDTRPNLFGNLHIEDLATADYRDASALLIVHAFGIPNEMKRMVELAHERSWIVIEDVAQAAGASSGGRFLGSWGSLGVFSFHTAHQIQAGEMGAVVGDDEELHLALQRFRNNGLDFSEPWQRRFAPKSLGLNLKPLEFSAALALAQLPDLSRTVDQRQRNADVLAEQLRDVAHLVIFPDFGHDSSPFAFPIICSNRRARDNVHEVLTTLEVETRPMFSCLPLLPVFDDSSRSSRQWCAADLEQRGLYIGCHEKLSAAEMSQLAQHVAGAIRKVGNGQ